MDNAILSHRKQIVTAWIEASLDFRDAARAAIQSARRGKAPAHAYTNPWVTQGWS